MKNHSFLIICLSFVTACKDNSVGNKAGAEFFPLAKGNYWRYASTPSLSQDSITVESVSGDTLVNGEKWSFLSFPSGKQLFGGYYSNRNDGLWTLFVNDARLLYKYPAELNEAYVINSNLDTLQVVGTLEKVDVPAGTFLCMVYQHKILMTMTDSTKVMYYDNKYIAPGVGKVKEELFHYDPGNLKKISGQYLLLDFSVQQLAG